MITEDELLGELFFWHYPGKYRPILERLNTLGMFVVERFQVQSRSPFEIKYSLVWRKHLKQPLIVNCIYRKVKGRSDV